MTPHKDAHNGNGETRPEWWGKTYFRHFPNHGFVGDIFTVNGTAYPEVEVKRRKYRLRFLDASISRIYEFKFMSGSGKSARDLGYKGDELQGQYRLPDGQQCMKFVEVANEGGLLPGRSCATRSSCGRRSAARSSSTSRATWTARRRRRATSCTSSTS